MSKRIERDDTTDGMEVPGPVAREIDENLKRVYRESLQADVPDRFLDLLAQLKAREAGKTSDTPEDAS